MKKPRNPLRAVSPSFIKMPNSKSIRSKATKIPSIKGIPRLFADRLKREKSPESLRYEEAIENIPRITNETVAEHREAVLSTARKYIYPLQHSKHRVVIISSILFVVAVVGMLFYTLLALYRFQTTSTFIYRITQVVPLPVAKAGSSYVSYENYLFELRHYMHYYETQQRVDFSSDSGKKQLESFKERAIQQVIDGAYVKRLAKEHSVTVSNAEVDQIIAILKKQNRLGSSDQVFSDVLKQFWGWSVDDFKRELRQQLLTQKVLATLDTATQAKANEALAKLKGGADFAAIAKEYSADPATRDNGGEYGFGITESNRDVSPQVVDELFKLKAGTYSNVINTGSTLEIDKVVAVDGKQRKAAHIVFVLKPLTTYVDPLKKESKPRQFIKT